MAAPGALERADDLGQTGAVPVAVTGMHRTGTSMIAKVLRLGGLWLGRDEDMIDPAPDNPEGFFEHAGMVRLNEELLDATGGAWDNPPRTGPLAADDPRVAPLGGEARQLLAELSISEPWGWKDPRTSLTAPFWLDLLPSLRFVICVRHPLEVALSLKRRNRISYSLGLSLWERYYSRLLDAVRPERRFVTHYEAHLDTRRDELDRMLTFVGLPLEAGSLASSGMEPDQRHHHLGISLAEAGVSSETVALYRRLCDEAGWTGDGDATVHPSATVHRAVLDLAATRELAKKQEGHILWLEGQMRAVEKERDALAGTKSLADTRARRIETLERKVDDLEAERGALVERLSAADFFAAVEARLEGLAGVEARLEGLEDVLHDALSRLDARSAGDVAMIGACREVVRTHVPLDAPVLVVGKSDPAFASLCGRPVSNFPQDTDGRYPGFAQPTGESAIAHLEALRARGHRFLLVPAPSRWWLDRYPSFGEHVVNRYPVVASGPNFGVLADLSHRRSPPDGWPLAVSDAIDRVARITGRPLAVLDWSDLEMAAELPNQNVFSPGDSTGPLPYLDDTIDVVLIEDSERIPEARRVGRAAIIQLRPTGGGHPEVASVDVLSDQDLPADVPMAAVVSSRSPEKEWGNQLREALAEESEGRLLFGPEADIGESGFVTLIDEGVLPLPGCLLAARTALASDERIGGVAVKLFASDGSLEASGVTAFADGSYARISSGSFDVGAAWHEYVRDTCWGPGLMVFRASALAEIARDAVPTSVHALWSARLWAAGLRVVYQPTAAAVRALPTLDEDVEAIRCAWASVPLRLPARPPQLDEPAWRQLLVEEDLTGSVR